MLSSQRNGEIAGSGIQWREPGLPVGPAIGEAHEALNHTQFADEVVVGGCACCQPCQAVGQFDATASEGIGLRFERLQIGGVGPLLNETVEFVDLPLAGGLLGVGLHPIAQIGREADSLVQVAHSA